MSAVTYDFYFSIDIVTVTNNNNNNNDRSTIKQKTQMLNKNAGY